MIGLAQRNRPDKDGTHRAQFDKNKKRIYATQKVCGICGKPVDFSIRYPHPLSPCIDHIIPVSKGGHPSDMDNLQLAHFTCNRQKSDKFASVGSASAAQGGKRSGEGNGEVLSNRILPQSRDWAAYRG